MAIQGDVAKKADIDRLFAETKKAFGKLDILVNNAGIYEFAPIEQLTEEHFHKQFNLNVLGLLLTTQQALNIQPRQRQYHQHQFPCQHARAAERFGLQRHERCRGCHHRFTGQELGARNIRVNAVRPGLVETEGTVTSGFTSGDFHDQYVKNAPLGRIGRPQDIAAAVTYLASDDSSWVSGEPCWYPAVIVDPTRRYLNNFKIKILNL